jgi:hypothetical protein
MYCLYIPVLLYYLYQIIEIQSVVIQTCTHHNYFSYHKIARSAIIANRDVLYSSLRNVHMSILMTERTLT